MKLRYKRKQFWWTWKGVLIDYPISFSVIQTRKHFTLGVGRIKHQLKK
jgi:hypothetical protein